MAIMNNAVKTFNFQKSRCQIKFTVNGLELRKKIKVKTLKMFTNND